MNRASTWRVLVIASSAWTFAVTLALFERQPGLVILAVGIAATASCWIIARYTAERLKRELLAELAQDVHPHPRR